MWVRSLDWEDPLEKEMATYSNSLIWENPWIEEPGNLQSMGSQKRHHLVDMNLVTKQQEQRLVVWSLSHVRLFETPWTAALQASLTFTMSRSLLKLMSIESVVPSNHLILCHSLLLPPSIFLSVRVFSSESALQIRWPKYWSFSISPSNEYSGLISFRND